MENTAHEAVERMPIESAEEFIGLFGLREENIALFRAELGVDIQAGSGEIALSGDADKVAAYRKFLTLGGSMKPIEELKVAGVDMSTPQPVCEALDYFAELVLAYGELEA